MQMIVACGKGPAGRGETESDDTACPAGGHAATTLPSPAPWPAPRVGQQRLGQRALHAGALGDDVPAQLKVLNQREKMGNCKAGWGGPSAQTVEPTTTPKCKRLPAGLLVERRNPLQREFSHRPATA